MASSDPDAGDAPETEDDLGPADVEPDAAARGGVYALLARGFQHPDEAFHDALAAGDVAAEVEGLLSRTALDVDPPDLTTGDDFDTLCARYNDLFVVGFSKYTDRTDGSLTSEGPPVPLYETAYRPNASWNDVNLDLARAYDYYDVRPAEEDREHHDYLPFVLEFAGYLARREAVVDADAAAAARLDLLDRHLRIASEGVTDRMADETGTDVYADFADLLESFSAADRSELVERLEGDP